MRFTSGLLRAVQHHPQQIATICNGRQTTFAQQLVRVQKLAGGLRKLGVRVHDKVAILALNSDRYLDYYLGVSWLGAIVNPINFRWSVEEVAYALRDSESIALFVDDAHAPMIDALLDACPMLRIVVFCGDGATPEYAQNMEALIASAEAIEEHAGSDDETFGVFYTGGTTGSPKGVLLSHRNLYTSALAMMAEGPFGTGSIGLHAAPMFHLADMMTSTCLLLRGGTHVMLPAFRPDVALQTIARHRITELLLVPAMMQALVDSPEFRQHDTSSVRTLLYGASPASESLIDRAQAAFPNVGFFQVYGMTELAATATILTAADHDPAQRSSGRLRSAGRSFCHARTRIVDGNGAELRVGQIGEILVRGPNVMQGYLNQPETSAKALEDGWMHTGDMGYVDEAGYVFIVDRLKDMIISGGENVYCAEVENAIAKHPAIAACAVVGIPSREWGETVHAAVVLRAGASLTQDELHTHCRQLIAAFKCPRSLEVRTALPVSGAGKVLKTEIRKPFWEGLARAVN